ncbi:ribosomal protein L12 family [Kipferlia bialata]|uniref:Ribosomal protein L12 family n=1 Tax=Kipferlia bialata TaxID=797122 RepID=A0A391NP73_9EUKA|nr:ribosomal protein L12 family [Kipferlia bialata]|eukprot:g5520.t1
MKYLAAYLLATLGGKAEPTKEDVIAVLESVDAEVDQEKIALLITNMAGKSMEEVLEAGRGKMASMPSAGAAAGPAATTAAVVEEESEEEEEESEEDSDLMGGLF